MDSPLQWSFFIRRKKFLIHKSEEEFCVFDTLNLTSSTKKIQCENLKGRITHFCDGGIPGEFLGNLFDSKRKEDVLLRISVEDGKVLECQKVPGDGMSNFAVFGDWIYTGQKFLKRIRKNFTSGSGDENTWEISSLSLDPDENFIQIGAVGNEIVTVVMTSDHRSLLDPRKSFKLLFWSKNMEILRKFDLQSVYGGSRPLTLGNHLLMRDDGIMRIDPQTGEKDYFEYLGVDDFDVSPGGRVVFISSEGPNEKLSRVTKGVKKTIIVRDISEHLCIKLCHFIDESRVFVVRYSGEWEVWDFNSRPQSLLKGGFTLPYPKFPEVSTPICSGKLEGITARWEMKGVTGICSSSLTREEERRETARFSQQLSGLPIPKDLLNVIAHFI